MKIYVVTFFLFFINFSCFSQTFDYKTVIKNQTGNTLSSQSVYIKVVLLKGNTANNNIIYKKTHIATIDDCGIVTIKIENKLNASQKNSSAEDRALKNYWIQVSANLDRGSTYKVIDYTNLSDLRYANNAYNNPKNNTVIDSCYKLKRDRFYFVALLCNMYSK